MYHNNMNMNMNGYGGGGPGPGSFRSSSGGRMWGMSHSLPSGMSRYAFSPQDTDFTSSYPTARRTFNDFPTSNTLATVGHMGSSSTSSLAGPGGGTNLIINYLPQDMTDRELFALFRIMGPIDTCRIMRDFKTGYSYGYGFINFCSEDDATRAIKSLNGVTVRNKRIKVSYARPGGDHLKDTNLYVTNLPRSITEDQLDIIFGKYGNIVQKNILRDKMTGKPRGVAFVRFNKREEAQEAISALNNVIPEGGNQPLTVRVAEEHGKQRANTSLPHHQFSPMPSGSSVYNNVMHRGRMKFRFQNHPYGQHNPHQNKMMNMNNMNNMNSMNMNNMNMNNMMSNRI